MGQAQAWNIACDGAGDPVCFVYFCRDYTFVNAFKEGGPEGGLLTSRPLCICPLCIHPSMIALHCPTIIA